ncbi:MAG: hypothetical protein H0U37_06285 [Chloroflexi bacterium]|nr:hypothetical protein [Chloroflexota bacterium]
MAHLPVDPNCCDPVRVAPLRRLRPVVGDAQAPMSHLDIQATNGRLPFGLRHDRKGHFLEPAAVDS